MPKFKLKYNEEFSEPVLGIDWNSSSNKILIVYGTESSIVLELKTSNWETVSSGKLVVEQKLKGIALHDNSSYALLVFAKKSIVVNLSDYSIYRELEREDGFLNGGFAEEDTIYLTIPAVSGSVDWSFWNYNTNSFQEYELERYGNYGRGAIIHPSKKLIGACWGAYQSGFLIHHALPENNRLKYFNFGENECSRSEYEAYYPSFNAKGDKIAFIVNPYLGDQDNFEKLCVYDIENQTKELLEIQLTNTQEESVLKTYFMGQSDFILLNKTCAIDVVDFESKEIERIVDKKADCMSANIYTNEFAFSEGKILSVYTISNKREDTVYNNNASIEYAASFISNHFEKLRIAGDKEIKFYTAISGTDEIPKLYVKFGFEKAVYRLDTKEIIEEKLTESTKEEISSWFNLNQETELSKWKQNNVNKKKTILKLKNGSPIEIFSGKRSMEQSPNIRIYYENSDWMIDIDEIKERESLPEPINKIVNNWIDLNYKEIKKPWDNTFDNYGSNAKELVMETLNTKSNFWDKLKNFWS
ncbi:hypothetical protein [Flavobacterium reichenbachii]|uniref:Uncharacterized protein n=1 Tax=Flavobacterium reichenbachii TaxID=362418 RepID=A0A085ZQF1_9FLAO|nr:hypothetical protein [Flavobacterium reichenbachii]KFF06665.1 hypothetical protein IW19_14620 [Flavobacterium reichenbachii]OXB18731.1 hypothetical protein B0A68_01580 [Flavobacterium reichenbachii]